jgi:hypothetical protein
LRVGEYRVRLALPDETELLMQFIDRHWRKGHILATDRDLFLYQYQTDPDWLNFVVASDEDRGHIDSLLGFIPANRDYSFLWTSMWKTLKGAKVTNLGMVCLEFLLQYFKPVGIASNSINPNTEIIYEFLGYQVSQMKQYYLANPSIKEFNLASFPQSAVAAQKLAGRAELIKIKDIEHLKSLATPELLSLAQPRKDIWYLQNRFFQHPRFDYQVYAICYQKNKRGFLVTRRITVKGSAAMRVVDFIGCPEVLIESGPSLLALVEEQHCEYVDFVQFGLSDEVMHGAGFRLNDHRPGLVVPEYFYPFEKKNVTLHIFTSVREGFTMFKADCDQDRPN